MSESVIIDAVRSPIGMKNGEMVGIRPDDPVSYTNLTLPTSDLV